MNLFMIQRMRPLLGRIKERVEPFAQPVSVICIASSLLMSIYWMLHLPASGKAVAWLGAVAVFLALRGEISQIRGSDKDLWTLMVFSLVYIEIRAIHKYRSTMAQDDEQGSAE